MDVHPVQLLHCVTSGRTWVEQLGPRYRLAASIELNLDLRHVTTFTAE